MTRHPYTAALEAHDAAALADVLHPDVTFTTPVLEAPVRGRDNVLGLFGVLATVFEDVEFVDELGGDGSLALVVRLRVDGHPLDAVDYVALDGGGRVTAITVLMRPLSSVQALAARMARPLAGLVGAP